MSPDSNTAQAKLELFTFELFERAAKVTIVAVGVLYSLGLLITNTYLALIGVSDFSSIKPKYIVTGAWSSLVFLLASLPSIFLILGWHELRNYEIQLKNLIVDLLSRVIVGIMITVYGYHILIFSLHIQDSFLFSTLIFKWTGSVSVAIIFSWYWIKIWLKRRSPSILTSKLVNYTYLVFVIWLAMILGGITLTAKKIYAKTPEALGGGKPTAAELIFNPEGMTFWKQAGATEPTSPSSTNSGRVLILYQDEHEFVIKTQYKNGNDKIIFLNKSLVQGFLPKEQ